MPPVVAIPVNVPATVDAPKFKLSDLIAALPALLSATVPSSRFACVDKLILAADVNVLPLAAVSTPLSVMSPVVDVADSAPPTLDAPKFSAADSMLAVPVPVVFNETGPLNAFALAKVMLWPAAEVVK